MTHADYKFWADGLAGNLGPMHDGDAQCGFYRKPRKHGVAEPVAIWRDGGGELVAIVGERQADPADIWSWVCRYPITEAVYRAVVAGEPWPDLAPGVAPPAPSSNSATADELDTIRDQIAAAKAGLAEFATIGDDTKQAAAQSLRSRLLELSREADKVREARKKPHLEAGKAIDADWQPLVKDAKAAADTIAKSMGAYETEKARKAEAERRRREDEAREAARIAEEALRKAGASEVTIPVAPEPEPEVAATPIKGAYGRAASVKVVKIATVTDQDAVYRFMRELPEVVELLASLAQRAVNAGHDVPGVTTVEERRVA